MTIQQQQIDREKNQRARQRRGVIILVSIAVFIATCLLGVYFGLFIGVRVAGGG